jgi:2',3'-cyclic-nucleotide 2'-phosphodiesterase (5'-nucleotidase family)
LGGLSKKASQFKAIAGEKNLPLLKVDGGGLLFDRLPPAAHELEQKKIAAAGIIKAYNRIGYAAVGVASLDLAGGVDFLRELEKKSRFAWLSANLIDRENG